LILESGKRLDGRAFDVVRPISSEVGILPRAHGSAIFSRGETQAVTLATLGTGDDTQEFDSYTGGETEKKFILHYNFPNFPSAKPEASAVPAAAKSATARWPNARLSACCRRIIPTPSASPARSWNRTVRPRWRPFAAARWRCWMPGVPMTRPVAGISVGICTEYSGDKISKYQLLTDIIGWEDHYCDMDCKIAGTEKGITGFQLDLKLKGIPFALMVETVEKARVARMHILAEMAKTLCRARARN
jgi:polyribonucleotide nucleotidyltransferase